MSTAYEYWSLDIPGLTEEQAASLERRLASEFESGVIVVSPRDWMVRMFDRSSVTILVSCLRTAMATGRMSHRDAVGAQSMLEDFEAWLGQTDE